MCVIGEYVVAGLHRVDLVSLVLDECIRRVYCCGSICCDIVSLV